MERKTKQFKVIAKVELFPQKGGWYFVRVPKVFTDMTKSIADRGLVPIMARVGETEWKTSLLPMGDGTHFIALNKKVMKAEKIELGKKVEVSFYFRV